MTSSVNKSSAPFFLAELNNCSINICRQPDYQAAYADGKGKLCTLSRRIDVICALLLNDEFRPLKFSRDRPPGFW